MLRIVTVLCTIIYLGITVGILKAQNSYSFKFNDKDYEIILEMETWTDAAAAAVERGGYLVQINSEEEQQAVYDAIINGAEIPVGYIAVNDGGGVAYLWIGATDKVKEGEWIWDGNDDSEGDNFWNGQGYGGSGNGKAVSNAYVNWGGKSTGTIMEPDDFQAKQDAAALALEAWPKGYGIMGSAGEWNDVYFMNKMYYIIEYPEKPEPPQLQVPQDGSYDINILPDFMWSEGDNVTFHFQLALTEEFSSDIVIDNSAVPSNKFKLQQALDAGTEFFWRVAAIAGKTIGDWSQVFSFTTKAEAPNELVTLVYPEADAEDLPVEFEFVWNNVANTEKYHLQVKKEDETSVIDNDNILISDEETTTFVSGVLDNNTVYYWRVAAGNNAGWGSFTEWSKYTTVAAAPENSPVHLTPDNNATEVTAPVVFQWQSVENADSYSFELYTDGDVPELVLSNQIEQSTAGNVEYEVSELQENTVYLWRTKALNAGGESDWSDYWQFTTSPSVAVEESWNTNKEVMVYPNPVSNRACFSLELSEVTTVQIEIYSANGTLLTRTAKLQFEKGNNTFNLDTSELSSGIYIYLISFNGTYHKGSFIISR